MITTMEMVQDHKFLTDLDVLGLLRNHPNSCDVQSVPEVDWKSLVQYYLSGESDGALPSGVLDIIQQIRKLQLNRLVTVFADNTFLRLSSEAGMSQKKAHEVARMTTYVVQLLRENNIPEDQIRLVDVGAGQASHFSIRSLTINFIIIR